MCIRDRGKSAKEKNRKLSFGFLIEWLNRRDVLSGQGKERFKKIQGLLNRYLHPYHSYMDIGKEKCSECPATTRYDENCYYEWLDIFQNVIELIVEIVCTYFPECRDTERGKEGLAFLKDLQNLEEDIGIVCIKCDYLRNFIVNLPEELIKED